ncbi:MAG: hypothetical protein HKN91_05550 [Acidimicrobiia bacterium]|nr:hypothetical protein [Acidimicrobiia bacterium]
MVARSRSRLSVRHLFLVVPIAGLAWAVTRPFRDNSFLWHVRAGTEQLDAGQVLTSDPFTIEYGGEAWRTQSWLADIAYGFLERLTDGVAWLPYYMFAMAALAAIVVLATIYRRTSHLGVTAAAGILLVWQASPFTAARPVIISYVLLASLAAALLSNKVDYLIPGLIWLWAALHGSFVVGIGLIVLEAIRRRSRRHVELAVISVILASLTAHGFGVWEVLVAFLGNREALAIIQEWQPPNYSNPFMLPYGLMVLGTIYAAAKGKVQQSALFVILPFLFFGMLTVRNLYPAMIVVLPYLAQGLTPDKPEVRRPDPLPIVAGFAAVILIVGLVGLMRPVRLAETAFPAPEALEALDPGPVFHGIAPGGYLIYAEWPERPILVDDRAELFGIDGFRRYLDVADGDGWEELFAELEISQALLDVDWPLVGSLATAGWIEEYRDDFFVVASAP